MSRPLVLLDVDGVLNALGPGAAWPDWQTGDAVADGRRFRIRWSPSVVSRVVRWSKVTDVHWLTTWGHDANRSLRHLVDLPELPVAGTYDDDQDDWVPPDADSHAEAAPAGPDELTGQWWKFDVVRRLVRADPERPLVWLDDDLAVASDMVAWTREHATASLLVAPDPGSGLVSHDLDAVDAFLAGVRR